MNSTKFRCKISEQQLNSTQKLCVSMLNLNKESNMTAEEILDYVLDDGISITQSKVGYVFFCDNGTIISTSSEAILKCDIAYLWGNESRHGKTVIQNDCTALNLYDKALLEEELPIRRYMSVPLIIDEKVVAIIGIANKESEYNDEDTQHMTMLLSFAWQKISCINMKMELIENEKRFNDIAENATGIIPKENENGEIICHRGSDRDIADNKRDVDILVGKENYNNMIFAGSTVPLCIIDPYSKGCKNCNNSAATLFEISSHKGNVCAYNRSLIEATLDPLVTIGPDGRITDVNSATERATGYSRIEIVGKYFQCYFTDRVKAQRAYELAYKDGSVCDYELELKHKDGHITPVLYNASVYKDQSGKVIGVFASARDISERKLWEQELKRKQQVAEEENASKSRFIANISHELRTPVNVILSAVQLFELYSKKGQDIGVNGNKHLQAMKQNCFRLLRIINNLIDISKIEAGFLELHLKNENIVKIVEDVTISVVEYAKGKDIDVQFDTEIEEKIVAFDPDKLERIMLNLLSNSVKFTEKGGNIVVNIYDREESVIISVRDTGIGIRPDNADKIFERFIQVENTLVRSNEGSGIGLSILKGFVEMHGGTVKLITQEGVGSEFIIELPVRVLDEQYMPDSIIPDTNRNCVEMLNIEFSDIYL